MADLLHVDHLVPDAFDDPGGQPSYARGHVLNCLDTEAVVRTLEGIG